MRGLIQGDGLLNRLTVGVSDGLNDAICNLIGPNFLRATLTDNDCLSGVELPTLFKSYKCYCEIFNRLSPNKRKCLSNAAARIQIELRSVIKLDLLLTKCCRTCDDYKSEFQMTKKLSCTKLLSIQLRFSNYNFSHAYRFRIGKHISQFFCRS